MTTSTFTKLAVLAALGLSLTTVGFAKSPASSDNSTYAVAEATHNVLANGSFSGRSDHVTRGQVQLIKTDTGYALSFGEDFYLDGAPDPVVGFGKDGRYDKGSQVADLKSKRGAQTYQLPSDFTPAQFNEIYVWCEKFSVPLGVASISTK